MTKSNSRIVTFIAVGVLIFGLVQLGQAAAISVRSNIAADYGANSTQITARIILALGWACVFVWQAFQLYRYRQSSLNLIPLGSILVGFLLYQLVFALLSTSPIDQQRWVLSMIVVICIIVLGWVFQRRYGRSTLTN